MSKYIVSLAALIFSFQTFAADDLLKDFDSLSGNDALLERARALNPELKTTIVQKRAVERAKRFEFTTDYSSYFGGDAYVQTQTVGLSAHYHFNYRWSIGLKYGYAFNQLSPEGENLLRNKELKAVVPAMDYVKQEMIATINWYPIYGKFSLYDLGVVHFDLYTLAGGGSMSLESGSSTALTAGAGLGIWISQHLTSRFEVKWLGYEVERFPGQPETLNATVGSLSIGYLL